MRVLLASAVVLTLGSFGLAAEPPEGRSADELFITAEAHHAIAADAASWRAAAEAWATFRRAFPQDNATRWPPFATANCC